ncbi:DNA-deoxyinosine glycosylase [Mycolicibacterium litorale]|nr:DNA-deoxyinosine glycosylase [Mycolicibacterium litorale]
MSRSPLLHGLAPIASPDAQTLILGNMPSVLSLAADQYYGNPRNAFWRIAGEVFGFDADAPYSWRTEVLRGHRIAVWDVLRQCRRIGSLDAAVEPDSMAANDFSGFFATHPDIERVYFNGAAAERNYRRLATIDAPVSYRRLPSTSPAQTMPFAQKLAVWRAALLDAR